MGALLVDRIAQLIHKVDGGNTLTAHDLGKELAVSVSLKGNGVHPLNVVAFVEHTNPDKAMGAGQLAELIVAEFDLEDQ